MWQCFASHGSVCEPAGTELELFLEDLRRLNQLKDNSTYQQDLDTAKLKQPKQAKAVRKL